MFPKLTVLALTLVLTACVNKPVVQRTSLQEFPVRVGVLADSQVTTPNETFSNFSFRSPRADKVSPVSLRPPALEKLSIELLDYFLGILKEQNVDLVLYLGDAANSGCQDELAAVFTRLAELRKASGIPSYFLIGNHDYLGTGNQTAREVRARLCDTPDRRHQNQIVSKVDLIKMVHEHNVASSLVDKNFRYAFQPVAFENMQFNAECEDSHLQLYYAAALEPKDRTKISADILLADTSNYNDVWFRPNFKTGSNCELLGFWGTKGSMSLKQINSLEALACQKGEGCVPQDYLDRGINPQFGIDYRIVASHYDPKSFNALYPWNFSPSWVKDNLGYLLSDGENIWLGAHHHYNSPGVVPYHVGKTIFEGPRGHFSGFSVGSTTDLYPHVAIMESAARAQEKITDKVGYTTYFAPAVSAVCTAVLPEITKQLGNLQPIQCGAQSYADFGSVLGTEKIYRVKNCWSESVYTTVRENIDTVLKTFSDGKERRKAALCLALTATEKEELISKP